MIAARGRRCCCPRCGHDSPPQETRLVTCASCGLSFDATRVAEPSAKPVRRTHGTRGVFRAPSMGYSAPPFPIAGEGIVQIGEHYLTVQGFRARGRLARLAAVMIGLALAIAIGVVLDRIGLPDRITVGVPIAVFLAGALRPLPPSKLPARFRIPWENIHAARLFQLRRGVGSPWVRIEVRDFAPTGEIHFVTDEPESFVRALRERARREEAVGRVVAWAGDARIGGRGPTMKWALLVVAACTGTAHAPPIPRPPPDQAFAGDPHAPVALMYWFDYECPYCLAFEPTLDAIEAKYGTRIVVYYEDFPISHHKRARPAAIAAEAARRQGKYMEMHRLLFATSPSFADDELRADADKLGLDLARYDADIADPAAAAHVAASYQAGDDAGVPGTPMLAIAGKLYDGDYDLPALTAQIDAALVKAQH